MLPFSASPAAGKEPLSSDFIAYGKGAFEEAKRSATGLYAGAMKQVWSPELPCTSEPVILGHCARLNDQPDEQRTEKLSKASQNLTLSLQGSKDIARSPWMF